MSTFDNLLTDTVSILKRDGKSIDNVKASIQKNKIFIHRSDLLIESGDLIQRKMSNGAEETYKVIDPGFHEKFHSIEAHYQMDVQKLGLPEANRALHSITFNVSGNNARINHNSVDNSSNVVNISLDIADNISALRNEIERLVKDKVEKNNALEVVDAIKAHFDSGAPKKSVVKVLLTGLPAAASIASIGSFLLSCIS